MTTTTRFATYIGRHWGGNCHQRTYFFICTYKGATTIVTGNGGVIQRGLTFGIYTRTYRDLISKIVGGFVGGVIGSTQANKTSVRAQTLAGNLWTLRRLGVFYKVFLHGDNIRVLFFGLCLVFFTREWFALPFQLLFIFGSGPTRPYKFGKVLFLFLFLGLGVFSWGLFLHPFWGHNNIGQTCVCFVFNGSGTFQRVVTNVGCFTFFLHNIWVVAHYFTRYYLIRVGGNGCIFVPGRGFFTCVCVRRLSSTRPPYVLVILPLFDLGAIYTSRRIVGAYRSFV